tara:strand:- start:522 stop:1307 length:786 start_codon:yes stop_codon:yes gene_type:complete
MDDANGCWRLTTPINEDNEIERVSKSIQLFLKRLKDIPDWKTRTSRVEPIVHGFGISSGGHLLAQLATDPSYGLTEVIHAIHIQIAAPLLKPKKLWSRIPVAFTVMERDWNIKSSIKRIATLVESYHVPIKIYETKSKLITRNYFRSRIPNLSKSLSGAIYNDLLKNNVINKKGELLINPKDLDHGIGPLSIYVHGGKRKPPQMSDDLLRILTYDELSRSQLVWISEELNVAWNQHEISFDSFHDVLIWLSKQNEWIPPIV